MGQTLLHFGGNYGAQVITNPSISTQDSFAPKIALNGSVSTQELCAEHNDSAVWVVVEGRGDCIRYFAHNIQDKNDVAAIWLSGDVIQSRINKAGRNTGNSIGWYKDNSAEKLLRYAKFWKTRSTKPYIWLSRPGIYGSSGDHKLRRQPRNMKLVNAAVNQIKSKYQISNFAFMGHSGGGHLIASLLSQRNDIQCAVIGSGVVSVAERNKINGWKNDITGYSTFVDPIVDVNNIQSPSSMRVFLVTDKRDKLVPFVTNENYNKKLKNHGIDSTLFSVKGNGKKFHQTQRYTSRVAADCLNGVTVSEIANRNSAEIVITN